MRIRCLFGALLLICAGANSIAAEDQAVLTIPQMVVVATRYARDSFSAPYTLSIRDDSQIKLRLQARTITAAMTELPGVMLQTTGHGMTSPHLRGLTGQRVVLIADGVRLNNAILREGPNQYWNSLSGMFYDSVEVLMGPASVLYGSDAVGGVVLVQSKPLQRGDAEAAWQRQSSEALLRYSSAERSFSQYLHTAGAFSNTFSFSLGLTNQNFGDLQSGANQRNRNTAYRQAGINARAKWWLNPEATLDFGFDTFAQDDVDRVHQTTDMLPFRGTIAGSDTRRTFDHQRDAAFVRYQQQHPAAWLDQLTLNLIYQQIREDYFADRRYSRNRFEFRDTRDDSYGFELQLRSLTAASTWLYGIDYQHDRVESHGKNQRFSDGAITIRPQGQVAADATYDLVGVYVQNERFVGEKLELVSGVRYTHARLDADGVNFPGSGVGSLAGSWDDVTASIRATYALTTPTAPKRAMLFAGVSQGFRAPNLSDATRDDDFGGGTEKPTADLEAEHFISYETGIRFTSPRLSLNLALYHIAMRNRIGRLDKPTPTKRNLDQGYINGIEAHAVYALTPQWQVFTNLSWQHGSEQTYYDRDVTRPGATRPVTRLMPLNGQAGLRWQHPDNQRYWMEFVIAAAAAQTRLADAEVVDNRIPDGGTPGYVVAHWRAGCRLGRHSDLSLAIENLADKAYRIHGSGLNEPGRNLVVSLRTRW